MKPGTAVPKTKNKVVSGEKGTKLEDLILTAESASNRDSRVSDAAVCLYRRIGISEALVYSSLAGPCHDDNCYRHIAGSFSISGRAEFGEHEGQKSQKEDLTTGVDT